LGLHPETITTLHLGRNPTIGDETFHDATGIEYLATHSMAFFHQFIGE
jgi:hypothetical protein